jgi:glycosyltransferase involved in cell wall biosynthesis
MKRILFVVHRLYPYPGGSEIYVYNMARALLENEYSDYDVTVLTRDRDGNKGDIPLPNGKIVKAIGVSQFTDDYDLIVIHGGDVDIQNVFHAYAHQIKSPTLYMIIKPSETSLCLFGLQQHDYIGYSTREDFDHCKKYGVSPDRLVYMPHGIPLDDSLGDSDRFFDKYGTELGPLFVSAGGFWPHKGFGGLMKSFHNVALDKKKSSLFLFGYSDHDLPPIPHNVHVIRNPSHDDVLDAIAAADFYVMNSSEEGFGLVLLEAMINHTPWIGTRVGAGNFLPGGMTYDRADVFALRDYLHHGMTFSDVADPKQRREERLNVLASTANAYDYVIGKHTMRNTVNAIEQILEKQDER